MNVPSEWWAFHVPLNERSLWNDEHWMCNSKFEKYCIQKIVMRDAGRPTPNWIKDRVLQYNRQSEASYDIALLHQFHQILCKSQPNTVPVIIPLPALWWKCRPFFSLLEKSCLAPPDTLPHNIVKVFQGSLDTKNNAHSVILMHSILRVLLYFSSTLITTGFRTWQPHKNSSFSIVQHYSKWNPSQLL